MLSTLFCCPSSLNMRCVLRIELAIKHELDSCFVYEPHVFETLPFDGVVVQSPMVRIDAAKRDMSMLVCMSSLDMIHFGSTLPPLANGLRYEYHGKWTCLLEDEDPAHPRWCASGGWTDYEENAAATILVAMSRGAIAAPRKSKPRIKPNPELKDDIIDVGSLPHVKLEGKHAFYVNFASGIQGRLLPWTRLLVDDAKFHPAFVRHLKRSHQSKSLIMRALAKYADEYTAALTLQLREVV